MPKYILYNYTVYQFDDYVELLLVGNIITTTKTSLTQKDISHNISVGITNTGYKNIYATMLEDSTYQRVDNYDSLVEEQEENTNNEDSDEEEVERTLSRGYDVIDPSDSLYFTEGKKSILLREKLIMKMISLVIRDKKKEKEISSILKKIYTHIYEDENTETSKELNSLYGKLYRRLDDLLPHESLLSLVNSLLVLGILLSQSQDTPTRDSLQLDRVKANSKNKGKYLILLGLEQAIANLTIGGYITANGPN